MRKANKLKTINNKTFIVASIIFFVFLITVRIINNLAIVEGATTKCNTGDKGNMGGIENNVAGAVGMKVLLENNIKSIQNTISKIKIAISKHSAEGEQKGGDELKKSGYKKK